MPNEVTTIDLLKAIRDSRLVRGSHRIVLTELALRGDPARRFSCFPSYERLSVDAGVVMSTTKKAVRDLREANLIRVKERPNRSNVYYINTDQILAAAEQAREAEAQEEEGWDPCMFGAAEPLPAEAAWSLEFVLAELSKYWPGHRSFQSPTWKSFLAEDMTRCIELAGSPEAAGILLRIVGTNEPVLSAAVGNSRRLGAYLVRCFPDWLEKFKDEIWPQRTEEEVVV